MRGQGHPSGQPLEPEQSAHPPGPDVSSAVIMGNQFAAQPRIENGSKGDVQILGNVTAE